MKYRELSLYLKTGVIGLLIFTACYSYLKWLGIPSELNKAAADTAILLMGFSMLQSGLSYYFNAFDRIIIYRKYFGLVGFAFAVAHLLLSWSAFLRVLQFSAWLQPALLPVVTGTLAFCIFTIMALISNIWMTKLLGSSLWRKILRTGYIAVLFVLGHVVLLKSARWVTWYQEGMQTPPSLSLLVSVFMVLVVVTRLVMWVSLARAQALTKNKKVVQPRR